MQEFDKDSLKNFLSANASKFKEIAVVMDFVNAPSESDDENFSKLVTEIETNPNLYNFISQNVMADFSIKKIPDSEGDCYIINNPFTFAHLIRDNSIIISKGEETWVNNILNNEEQVKSACCGTRRALMENANLCYDDLLNQCDSTWIFVQNIKQFVKKDKINFYNSKGTLKQV